MKLTTILAAAAIGFASMFSVASAAETCQSVAQVQAGAPEGLKVSHYSGSDAVIIRQFVADTYNNGDLDGVLDFDEVLFGVYADKDVGIMIIFKNGCAISGGPVPVEQIDTIIKKIADSVI